MTREQQGKSSQDITREWDELAEVRLHQILSGQDLTFNHILAPLLLGVASRADADSIVDAGCGVGALTNLLADLTKHIVGVDPSVKSIELARKYFGNRASFWSCTFEEYSRNNISSTKLVIANMVLMDTLDLPSFMDAAHKVLKPGGLFAFSITHPWFWPEYYGYSEENWFSYKKEMVIEAPFKISRDPSANYSSTHIHRPLQMYVESFTKAGFKLEEMLEPMPSKELAELYPKKWKYPRYLVGLCRRE